MRVADFDEMTKSILEDAISLYRVIICSLEPFPGRLEDRDLAAEAWVRACEDRKVHIDFNEEIVKLVISCVTNLTNKQLITVQMTARASQARGQLKTHSQPIVEAEFGLSSENTNRENRDKVEHLLNDLNYLYKVCTDVLPTFFP